MNKTAVNNIEEILHNARSVTSAQPTNGYRFIFLSANVTQYDTIYRKPCFTTYYGAEKGSRR